MSDLTLSNTGDKEVETNTTKTLSTPDENEFDVLAYLRKQIFDARKINIRRTKIGSKTQIKFHGNDEIVDPFKASQEEELAQAIHTQYVENRRN